MGRIISEDDQIDLPGATIQLIHLDDSTSLFTTTNEDGWFGLTGLNKGAYTLNISYVGYQPVSRHIGLEADQELKYIPLSPKEELLNEIVIVEKLPRAIQKGDTTEFNAQAYKTQPDASAEDMVRKMPGIIMNNGRVQAQGEEVQQVLIDGKPFFGNDASAALKNLPAEVIDKIQVFDRQSDQSQFTGFDDGQSSKTINIVTRVDKRNGQFGKLYLGYGLDNRYGLGGNVNVFNGDQRFSIVGQSNNVNIQNFATEDLLSVVGSAGRGGSSRSSLTRSGGNSNFLVGQQSGISRTHAFGINYSDSWSKKLVVSGSYFFNNSNNHGEQTLEREVVLSTDSSQFYDENSLSESSNFNHRFNIRMVYKLDDRNSIIYQPALSLQQNVGNEQASAISYLEHEHLLNSTLNEYSADLTGLNFSNKLLYRHRFEKKGRTLSLRLNTLLNQQHGKNNLLANNTFFTNHGINKDSLNQSGILDNFGKTYAANVTYTEPLGGRFGLLLNYEASLRESESDRLTYHFDEPSQDYTQLDSTLSNQFVSQYFAQEAGTGLRYNHGNFSLMTRVNYQLANQSNDQTFPLENNIDRIFHNVLPSTMLHFRFEEGNNLRVAYRTSTSTPDVKTLQSVIDNSNPLMLRKGNPELKQQYQHHLFGRFGTTHVDKATSFFVMLSGNYTNDYVGNSTFIAKQDTLLDNDVRLQQGAQLSMPVNFENSWSLRSFMSYGMPVTPLQSNLNFNSSVNFNRNPSLINDQINYASKLGFGLGMVLSSNMSQQLDFTLSSRANYNLIENSLRKELNNNYYNQQTELKLHARTEKGLLAETGLNHQFYAGLSNDFNQNYLLVNLSMGKKVCKNKLGELKLTIFDLLNQNNSISRNVEETYVEDVQTNVLNRFVMLAFTYNLRNFHM